MDLNIDATAYSCFGIESTCTDCLNTVIQDVKMRGIDVENNDAKCRSAVLELNSMFDSEEGIDTLQLRKYVLKKGLPFASIYHEDVTLRVKIWKLLLGVPCSFSAEHFLQKVEDCSDTLKDKVKDDAFRTFKGNELFWSKVEVPSLVRVLSAVATDHGYVQGMNVLLGPFAYVMPELDAYYCMCTLITSHIPGYVLKNLDGVHRGVAVFDRCLKILDPRLYAHITSKIPDLTIFSLRYIMTLLANAQPLESVLRLWDAMFAFGIHLNVLVLAVHLMTVRDKILALHSGFKILKLIEETPLDCEVLVQGALSMVAFVPAPLFEDMMAHPLLLAVDSPATIVVVATAVADSSPATTCDGGSDRGPLRDNEVDSQPQQQQKHS